MKVRAVASVILAGAVLLVTSGCGLFATIATQIPYTPSDGVSATIGDVRLINVIALTDNESDVSLSFTAYNGGRERAEISLQFSLDSGTVTETITVPAGESVTYGWQDEEVVLRDVDVTLGSLLPMYAQYGTEQGQQLHVPVLDGTLEPYGDILPTPQPTVTVTPTPSPTESAAPDTEGTTEP